MFNGLHMTGFGGLAVKSAAQSSLERTLAAASNPIRKYPRDDYDYSQDELISYVHDRVDPDRQVDPFCLYIHRFVACEC